MTITHADNEQRLDLLKADREAWQHQLEDATAVRTRALGLLHGAEAAISEARHHVRDDSAEIDRLQTEIPSQRHGG